MDILEEAKQIVEGDRREAYGPVEESFKRHAMVWSAILLHKLKADITPQEVALMMVGLKLMREANSPKRDNRVDMHGYLILENELYERSGMENRTALSDMAGGEPSGDGKQADNAGNVEGR